MIVLRQREFGIVKKLKNKYQKDKRDLLTPEDPEAKRRVKEADKNTALALGAAESLGLGLLGAKIGGDYAKGTGALIGASTGAGLGILNGHLFHKSLKKNRAKFEEKLKTDKFVKMKRDYDIDKLNVIEGKMTKEDFKKKWENKE